MVAYSYKKRFVPNIRAGLGIATAGDEQWVYDGGITRAPTPKTHTIRADRKRHARPGEEIQHYCGMRTKHCFLIGRGRCTSINPIRIRTDCNRITIAGGEMYALARDLDAFARSDGFSDWYDMKQFWADEHPGLFTFDGVIIKWESVQ